MEAWQTTLRADPTPWLLEADNPSVRYFALTDLMDMPETSEEATAARAAILQTGLVPRMLQEMAKDEFQATLPAFYTRKYKGLVWSLIVLAELGAPRTAQIEALCEYLLTNAQDHEDGGFSMHTAVRTGGGRVSEVIPCLTGNMVWSLIRMGYGEDPRVLKGLDWLIRRMRYNDGVEVNPQTPPYAHYDECWGAHTCHMGVVKVLKAYGAVPPGRRTGELAAAIEEAAQFMLLHHVDRRSHNLRRLSKPGWRQFGFPLMYQTDTLEVLDCLTALGYRDPRMAEALACMRGKQGEDGAWRLENDFAALRVLIPFGQIGERDKWVTLRAMRVLKRSL